MAAVQTAILATTQGKAVKAPCVVATFAAAQGKAVKAPCLVVGPAAYPARPTTGQLWPRK